MIRFPVSILIGLVACDCSAQVTPQSRAKAAFAFALSSQRPTSALHAGGALPPGPSSPGGISSKAIVISEPIPHVPARPPVILPQTMPVPIAQPIAPSPIVMFEPMLPPPMVTYQSSPPPIVTYQPPPPPVYFPQAAPIPYYPPYRQTFSVPRQGIQRIVTSNC